MIHTINHIGIGVDSIKQSEKTLLRDWGFKLKVSDSTYRIHELEKIFGYRPLMRMSNWMHPYTGPSLEFFQHKQRAPEKEKRYLSPAGCGISELGLLVSRIEKVSEKWKGKYSQVTGIHSYEFDTGEVWKAADFLSGEGLQIQLIEKSDREDLKEGVLGISHVGITVSDMELMMDFYSGVLEFDEIMSEIPCRESNESNSNNRIWLRKKNKNLSPLSAYNGGVIKLSKQSNSEYRGKLSAKRFGEGGLTEIGLEVSSINSLYRDFTDRGIKGLVEPLKFSHFMGPVGILAYIHDPEGNVIELVELTKVFNLSLPRLNQFIVGPLNRIYSILNKNRRIKC